MINSVYIYSDDGGHKLTIVFNVSNQPPVQVDISFLDEIKNIESSYASLPPPPMNSKIHLQMMQVDFLIHPMKRKGSRTREGDER